MSTWNLDVHGLRLTVREISPEGQHEAHPVVCLHGWLDSSAAFDPVARGRPGRWIAMDQRGFGQSGHIGAGGYYHFGDLLPDLDALVNSLGGPVDLVGHSMGGTVAAMYTAIRPENVRRLVVAEGLGAIEFGEKTIIERMRTHLDGMRYRPNPVRFNTVEEGMRRLLKRHPGLNPSHAAQLVQHGISEDEHGPRWAFDPLHMVPGIYPFREEWFIEFLEAITAQTLIVWGSQSWYSEESRLRRAAAIKGATVRTLEGGHMLPYDAPEALGDLIAEHLQL